MFGHVENLSHDGIFFNHLSSTTGIKNCVLEKGQMDEETHHKF